MSKLRVCLDCHELSDQPRCPKHRGFVRRFYQGATAYNRKRWIVLRDAFRDEHPECVNAHTGVQGCTLLTDVVDHIVPHRGDEVLMYDRSNLAPMCAHCHGRKTAQDVRDAGRRE